METIIVSNIKSNARNAFAFWFMSALAIELIVLAALAVLR